MNKIEDREKVRDLFKYLDFYKDTMTPNETVYVDAAKKQFLENGEFAALMEFGTWDNLNVILRSVRLQKINQCI